MAELLMLALLPLVAIAFFSPLGRLFVVTCAGLVVFTPGYAPAALKITFVVLLLLASAVSLKRIQNLTLRPDRLLVLSAVFFALTLLLSLMAGGLGDPQRTLQNGLPYALTLLIVPIAVDAGANSSWRRLEFGILAVGFVATISFVTYWLDKRGIASVNTGEILAASFLMPALIFQWGLVVAGDGRRRSAIRWVGLTSAFLIPTAFFVTGLRSAAALSFGVVGLLLWGLTRARFVRTLASMVVAIAAAVPILSLAASGLLADTGWLWRRFESLGDQFAYGFAGDGSWLLREEARFAALSVLESRWLFGAGLSTPNPIEPFDTPLGPVMRLGLIGVIAFFFYIYSALHWSMKIVGRDSRGDCVRGVIIGWSLITLAYGILIPPVDDTLFGFAFGFVIALAVCAHSEMDRDQSVAGPANVKTFADRSGTPPQHSTNKSDVLCR